VRAYRVFPYRSSAAVGEPGHPDFVPPSRGANRIDNPEHYTARYFAEHAAGAVAETMGQYDVWVPGMFRGRPGSGMRRAVASYEIRKPE
jgi:hypothetical protein